MLMFRVGDWVSEWVCVCAFERARVGVCVSDWVSEWVSVCMLSSVHVCVCVYVCACVLYVYVFVRVCVFVRVRVYMYAWMCTGESKYIQCVIDLYFRRPSRAIFQLKWSCTHTRRRLPPDTEQWYPGKTTFYVTNHIVTISLSWQVYWNFNKAYTPRGEPAYISLQWGYMHVSCHRDGLDGNLWQARQSILTLPQYVYCGGSTNITVCRL
jgi:hypothetical protein